MGIELERFRFLGSSFDCDDDFLSITQKREFCVNGKGGVSPYKGVVELVKGWGVFSSNNFLGELPVSSWISCFPKESDLNRITAENFIEFMEKGGCFEEAEKVANWINKEVLPDVFCFIGVDHCLTGGIIKALVNHYGRDDLSVIVLDAHTDAIPTTLILGLIHYDIETNKDSVFDKEDRLLYDRIDSYNASSFFYYLLREKIVNPKNLFFIGVCDYPPKEAFRIKDKRVVAYTNFFKSLKKKGTKIFTQKEVQVNFKKIERVINRIRTPYIYVSIDMDIGAMESVEAVRFKNRRGLPPKDIYKLIKLLKKLIMDKGKKLVGIDFMEFNPREKEFTVKTYEFAVNILKKLIKEG